MAPFGVPTGYAALKAGIKLPLDLRTDLYHIVLMRARKKEISEPASADGMQTFSLRIPTVMLQQLETHGAPAQRNVARQIRFILSEWLDAQNGKAR